MQDIGFDLTHPNFYSTDMSRYRIKALWDQLSRDTVGSSLYVGRDYVGQNALLQIGHPVDGLTQTQWNTYCRDRSWQWSRRWRNCFSL